MEKKKGDPWGEEVWARCVWEAWGRSGYHVTAMGEIFCLLGAWAVGSEGTFLPGTKGHRKLPFMVGRSIVLVGSRPPTRRVHESLTLPLGEKMEVRSILPREKD